MIDKVINDKVAFKESVNQDSIDITEKFVFINVVGPCAGATSNRKLFKRALALMYGGKDHAKHFMRPYWKGFTSKVVSKLPYGVVVSMFDFHRSDRGSNPGRGGKIS